MDAMNLCLILYQVIVIIAVIHVVMDNRQPAKTMVWALILYFVPIIGILAYIFFGVNTRRKRLVSRRSLDQLTRRSMFKYAEQPDLVLPEEEKPLIDLFINQNFSLPFGGNDLSMITNGHDFFLQLLRDIGKAEHHIHIDLYIFEDDALGRLIADALIDRARHGVEVRIVYDDVGCWGVKKRFFERMREAGIEAVPFMPVHFPPFTSKANYRNHRKLIVIDGNVGYIGGMNIALRYTFSTWRDTMVRIEGRGVYSLQRAFLTDWYFADRTLLSDKKYYPVIPVEKTNTETLLQTVTSGPSSPEPEILQGYLHIILNARRYIYIETPYFLPTNSLLFALKTAVTTGVNVRLLVPRNGDTWLTSWASRSYLREVSEAGVQVFLYEAGFLHSKLMVCDDHIATCGSTNIDFRSLENNFEANTFFYGKETAQRMRDIFLNDEKRSTPLTDIPDRISPSFRIRLWESFTRMLSPLL
ncbi:cardiolipin synthase [Prevotella sp. E9-3]|uniref:cardiolipin synthase n=1 Tax=Prevotella sp. E9-3 TaxID=2913621 RepID=UPI001EDB31D9|nr:cardiolipin synthase [Prevotella sp. E9-3]UKK48219.1 cardiolipin synthase [Prevotella sp. E9-3]